MKQIINYLLFGISIVFLGTSIILNVSHTVVTNESIVLVFIGILATFIIVGNYAQVIEIKNGTAAQIRDLELKTQDKIDKLNSLFEQMSETTEKIESIEKNVEFISAEAYRLYGIYCSQMDLYRKSCKYFLDAVSLYGKDENNSSLCKDILNVVLSNMETEKWNGLNQNSFKFDYHVYSEKVRGLPGIYTQKQTIIDLLQVYSEAENENN